MTAENKTTAARRDALLDASIEFIGTLTGMKPPPIEVAPPEVFAPFRAFVEKVEGIVDATRPAPATATVGEISDEQIASLRDKHGITSTGQGIRAFAQIRAFARAILAQRPAAADVPAVEQPKRLTSPARVGGGTFGVGVEERHVIDAAQRLYLLEGERQSMTPDQQAEEERNRRALWDMVHGTPHAKAPAQEHEAARQWRSEKTVGDLVNNLLMLDQSLPIYGAQYIEHQGRRRAIAVPPTASRERVKDGRWIGEGEDLNSIVVWTRAAHAAPASQAVTASGDGEALLDWLQESCCDLRTVTTGEDDYIWVVIEHHMAKPHEREIGRSTGDDPREAIRAARQQGGQ